MCIIYSSLTRLELQPPCMQIRRDMILEDAFLSLAWLSTLYLLSCKPSWANWRLPVLGAVMKFLQGFRRLGGKGEGQIPASSHHGQLPAALEQAGASRSSGSSLTATSESRSTGGAGSSGLRAAAGAAPPSGTEGEYHTGEEGSADGLPAAGGDGAQGGGAPGAEAGTESAATQGDQGVLELESLLQSIAGAASQRQDTSVLSYQPSFQVVHAAVKVSSDCCYQAKWGHAAGVSLGSIQHATRPVLLVSSVHGERSMQQTNLHPPCHACMRTAQEYGSLAHSTRRCLLCVTATCAMLAPSS